MIDESTYSTYIYTLLPMLAKNLKMWAVHKDVHENKDTVGN